MKRSQGRVSVSMIIVTAILTLNAIVLLAGYSIHQANYWWLIFTLPLLLIALHDVIQTKHAIVKNYPVIGHLRYLFEAIRPEMRQYFFESDLDGRPFNRRQRSIVYQRAKNEKQTVAFGMQANPTAPGYEWVAHSVYPVKIDDKDLRVWVGNKQC